MTAVFNDNSLEFAPAPPAGLPLFIYKAVQDEVNPVADTDALSALFGGEMGPAFFGQVGNASRTPCTYNVSVWEEYNTIHQV